MDKEQPTLCVTIPCLNEEATIGKVIDDFRRELPESEIVVFDNLSSDRTAAIAKEKGAAVIRVKKRGKGSVVQSIFGNSLSDIVIMVDGDDTYPAESVRELIEPLLRNEADMVVGTRLERLKPKKMQVIHQFGNRLLTGLLNLCFGTHFKDILSGYRAFNRNFLDNIPLVTPGFETETELTLQALEHGMIVKEVPISYRERPANSNSKIRTLHDGYRILLTIVMLLRDHRPLPTFSLIAVFLALLGLGTHFLFREQLGSLWIPIVFFASFLTLAAGFFLNTINTRFREIYMLLKKDNGQ